MNEKDAEAVVSRVIDALGGYKGFDWWWDDLDSDDQDTIVSDIASGIRR